MIGVGLNEGTTLVLTENIQNENRPTSPKKNNQYFLDYRQSMLSRLYKKLQAEPKSTKERT